MGKGRKCEENMVTGEEACRYIHTRRLTKEGDLTGEAQKYPH